MATNADDVTDDQEGGSRDRREQSSIAFPYLDLDAAIDVAKAIYNRAGLGSCELHELAAEMGQVISGAFRLKTGTAKTFGLTEKDGKSGIRLSELGRQIVHAETERAARAEAFLRVPLYERIYDKYKGHLLPPPKALEREMQSLGVSSKQTDKARQAFDRSAKQAGFFEAGEERLVRPRVELPTKRVDDEGGGGGADRPGEAERPSVPPHPPAQPPSGKGHPLIQGLLLTLPEPGQDWDAEGRAAWLRMAASIFDNLYSGASGQVSVTAQKDTAAGQ
jgi:hypothetical protein